MSKKKKCKSKELSSLFVPGVIVLSISIVTVLVIFFCVDKKYEITVNGKKYACTKREKLTHKNDDMETYVGISKEKYNSLDEAMEACKQDEVIVYSSTGELEEYQEAMTKCEYKDEDSETYHFYQDDVYSYKDCQEIK